MAIYEWCWLRTLWVSARSFLRSGNATPISGHAYVEVAKHEGCTVQVLKCPCGHQSIGWWK